MSDKFVATLKKIVEHLTESDTLEIFKVVAKTIENIFTTLVTSGGKPVAIILSIAILIVALAVPIHTLKQSPNQIKNLPAIDISEIK